MIGRVRALDKGPRLLLYVGSGTLMVFTHEA